MTIASNERFNHCNKRFTFIFSSAKNIFEGVYHAPAFVTQHPCEDAVYILTIIYRALSLMQCQKLSVYRYENINSLETELLIKHIKTLPIPLAVEIQICDFSIPAVEHLQKSVPEKSGTLFYITYYLSKVPELMAEEMGVYRPLIFTCHL